MFLRFDHVTGTADVLHGDPAAVAEALADAPSPAREPAPASGATTRTPGRAEHERRVRLAQDHIRRGDAFQIVLSQRAERPSSASPLAVYRAASLSAARTFGLSDRGLVAPGWRADLAILNDIETCAVEMVVAAGRVVGEELFAERGKLDRSPREKEGSTKRAHERCANQKSERW